MADCVWNVLFHMGIMATLEAEYIRFDHPFRDLDEAVAHLERLNCPGGAEPILRSTLGSLLPRSADGEYRLDRSGGVRRFTGDVGTSRSPDAQGSTTMNSENGTLTRMPVPLCDRNEARMSSTVTREPCCRRRGRPPMNQRQSRARVRSAVLPRSASPSARSSRSLSCRPRSKSCASSTWRGSSRRRPRAVLGISRKTLWRDLHEARRKVTDALVNGRMIEVAACSCAEEGACPHRNRTPCTRSVDGLCPYTGEPAQVNGSPE